MTENEAWSLRIAVAAARFAAEGCEAVRVLNLGVSWCEYVSLQVQVTMQERCQVRSESIDLNLNGCSRAEASNVVSL